jgi:ABC-2 type transport system permease protein
MKLIEMVRKEYYLLLRRKKFLIMVIALPIFLAGIFSLTSTLTSLKKINIGLCDLDNTAETAKMVQSLENQFTVQTLNASACPDALIEGVKQETFLLGIMIPSGFADKLTNLQQANINIYYDNSKPQLATTLDYLLLLGLSSFRTDTLSSSQAELTEDIGDLRDQALTVQGFLNLSVGIIPDSTLGTLRTEVNRFVGLMNLLYNMDVAFLSNPVSIQKQGTYPDTDPLAVAFSIVFCILSMFSSFMLCSTNVIYDRENNFITRLRTSKTSFPLYFLSKLIIFNALGLLQLVLVFGLFALQGTTFFVDPMGLFVSFLMISSLNIMIGIFIGIISENETTAVMTSLLLTLPFLFLSGVFFPPELFPDLLRMLTNIFPLNIEILLLKKVSLFAFTVIDTFATIRLLGYYIIFFFGLNWFLIRNKKA